jgi:hypothetical protein
MVGNLGDWIITGVQGEKYFCKPDIFEATYESVGSIKRIMANDVALHAEVQRLTGERARILEALELRVSEMEKRRKLDQFDDEFWEQGWLKRQRGVEDAIAIIAAILSAPTDTESDPTRSLIERDET